MHSSPIRRVTVASACRDLADRVDTFAALVNGLDWPAEDLRVAVCEGDSVDGSWEKLQAWAAADPRVTLVKLDTGAPRYGSVVDAGRFRQLAQVFNAALGAVDLEWSDTVLFVPFDVEYGPRLLRRLAGHGVDMVSPLTWLGGIFYDTWALTPVGGTSWPNFQREWGNANLGRSLLEMETVGGTVLMDAAVLRAGCRYTEAEVDRGLSSAARAQGFRLWVDPTVDVFHPLQ